MPSSETASIVGGIRLPSALARCALKRQAAPELQIGGIEAPGSIYFPMIWWTITWGLQPDISAVR
jgi:hypothetical protein